MKYVIKRIYVDPGIWDIIDTKPDHYWAQRIGCHRSYLVKLRQGEQCASEDFYRRIKDSCEAEHQP